MNGRAEPITVRVADADRPDRSAPMRAGIAAGIAGLATFLVLHDLWIVPIWSIAPVGAPVAAVGGAAVGVAYADLGGHLPGRPWTAIALAAVVGGPLLAAMVVAEAGGPIFEMGVGGGGKLLVSGTDAAVVVLGCLGSAVAAAVVLGGLVGRRRRAAGTMAVAALAMAIGPGHNIPMLGGSAAVAKEIAMLTAVIVVSSAVLVEVHHRLERPSRPAPVNEGGPPSVR